MVKYQYNRRTFLVISGATAPVVIARYLHGAIGSDGPSLAKAASTDVKATATRAAELDELESMRTKVAQALVCVNPTTTATPAPTATATQAPPAAAGTFVHYSGKWDIKVLSIAPALAPGSIAVNGRLLQVNYAMRNLTAKPALPPYIEFELADDLGHTSTFDLSINQALFGSAGALPVAGNATENRSVAFDFPNATSSAFIFRSSAEPEFRVLVTIQNNS
jgi:hypothetical protein